MVDSNHITDLKKKKKETKFTHSGVKKITFSAFFWSTLLQQVSKYKVPPMGRARTEVELIGLNYIVNEQLKGQHDKKALEYLVGISDRMTV